MADSYTVSLALYDYVPVVLSSLGFLVVARLLRTIDASMGRMGLLGWALITVGGLAKATWKLVLGITDGSVDVRWLDNSLFIFMAAGFVFAAAAIGAALRGRPGGWQWATRINLVVYALAGWAAFRVDGRAWFFVLLGVAALANTVAVWLLGRHAWSLGRRRAATLFFVNLVVVLVLPGFARIPDQTIPLQWIEQSTNLVAQVAFFAAARSLAAAYAADQSRDGPAVHGGA